MTIRQWIDPRLLNTADLLANVKDHLVDLDQNKNVECPQPEATVLQAALKARRVKIYTTKVVRIELV